MKLPAAIVTSLILLAGALSGRTADRIRVAVYSDVGAGRSLTNLTSLLAAAADIEFFRITADEIRSNKLHGVDVLIHPGGSGGKQGRHLNAEGRDVVRSFVRQGGGYLGICAGAYLASNDYDWSLNLIDAKVLDRRHWARGTGTVVLRLSPAGRRLLRQDGDEFEVYYGQGPLLAPKHDPAVPDYEELAVYRTEIAKKGAPKGVMPGTTAIARGHYGAGRVFCFSPHPERTPALYPLVHRAIRWSAGRQDPPESASKQP